MDIKPFSGVRAIVARNEAVAREAVGVLFAGLEAQQARHNGLGDSQRWIAISRLFEDEGRKLVRTSTQDVRTIDATVEAFEILEDSCRSFVNFLEENYFGVARNAAPFGGSRPDQDQENNPLSKLWRQARERLQLEIEASRAAFDHGSANSSAKVSNSARNNGGKPLAKHWDKMWAFVAVQLYSLELQPETQADIERAMADWFSGANIDVGETAIRQRAQKLWNEYQRVEK